MDLTKVSKPIVMAKPVRGREMQSTIIPKDVVDTVRAVSTKQIRGQSIVENLQKPREGEMEVYHEGYVDGKLYLVPDTNLQAMRDIVNLKMKRRHSSAEKPQTSLDEPTQYTEFKSKLDSLLGKIDQLADSSYDESEGVDGSEHLKNKKRKGSRERPEKPKTGSSSFLEGGPNKKTTDTNKKTLPKKAMISPMMDENTRYIRTRPTGTKKPEKLTKNTSHSDLQIEGKNKTDTFNLIEGKNLANEPDIETFTLLISGHLRNGAVPIFINHQNYTGPNILENETTDFKTHKKEGSIDIFISGKFFTHNILKEESFESPAILDIKPHKIVIDKDDIHRRKFKNVYKLGPIEVALEGEFKKNSKTLKYTPVFSLNIIKDSLLEENEPSEYMSGIKRVHYASGSEEALPKDVNSIQNKVIGNKRSLLQKIKNSKIYKILFPKHGESNEYDKSTENESFSYGQQMRTRSSKSKREELARLRRSRLRDRKARRGQNRKLYDIPNVDRITPVYKYENETRSPFDTRDTFINDRNVTRKVSNTKKVKKIRKVKNRDKNQAIVENPILAQMQEFFIA